MKIKQNSTKANILILYHSGSGSTKTIAGAIRERLIKNHTVDIASVHDKFNYKDILNYDLLVLGFPTYNFEPSRSMMEFIEKMPLLSTFKPAVVFTTCGMYSGNSLRIAISALEEKNITAFHNMQIKGPDSYMGLLNPPKSPAYENKTFSKIKTLVEKIDMLSETSVKEPDIPMYKWYVPLNATIKAYTTRMTKNDIKGLRHIEELCTDCNRCVKGCLNKCWQRTDDKLEFNNQNCEFCLRCVHNCPQKAIVFSEKIKNSPRFDSLFYKNISRLAGQ